LKVRSSKAAKKLKFRKVKGNPQIPPEVEVKALSRCTVKSSKLNVAEVIHRNGKTSLKIRPTTLSLR